MLRMAPLESKQCLCQGDSQDFIQLLLKDLYNGPDLQWLNRSPTEYNAYLAPSTFEKSAPGKMSVGVISWTIWPGPEAV